MQFWISYEPMHDGLSVTFGRSRGVRCFANNSLFPLSLTTLTTHSLGTDWYEIVALEPICQISRQHLVLWTSESSTLHLVQVSNEFDIVLSSVSKYL